MAYTPIVTEIDRGNDERWIVTVSISPWQRIPITLVDSTVNADQAAALALEVAEFLRGRK